ncbi:MAG: hypothetical protein HYV09_00120 [Deltaproteobacteria bacterium]|nr:hypothetical protein [Deltaproteobacteria bacterium]
MTDRRLGSALLGSVGLFLAAYALAVAWYPGGTWFDRHSVGYDLLRNFVCDLTQPIALDGRPNPIGAFFGKASMLALDAGLSFAFLGALRLGTPTRALARTVRVAAAVSFAGIATVPLTPSLVLGALHTVAVLTGVIAGLFAGSFALALLRRSPFRRISALGVSVFVVSFADAGIYAWSILSGTTPLALPMLQRVALVLLVLWLAAIGWALFNRARLVR